MATLLPGGKPETPGTEVVVLIVEDNEDDFFLLKRAFRQAGIKATLVWAKDGVEGQEYLARAIAERRLPSCILVDLKLPRMDGFELLYHIKGTAALNQVPVSVLSVSSNPLDMARAYRLGAKTYLVKPSALDSLVLTSFALQNQWASSVSNPAAGL